MTMLPYVSRGLFQRAAKPVAPGKGASVVLLLDVSASSAQQSEGISVISSMQAMAGRTLNSLQHGSDKVNIVYASAKPKKAFPEVSNNFTAVRQELRHVEPTQERADLAEAVALAGQLLHDQGGQRRLVILSDMQRTNWSDVTLQEQAGTLLPKGTQVTVLPVSGGKVANTALSEPRAFPVQPIVGQPLQLVVHVVNYAETERTVKVSSTVDGRAAGSQEVTLKPWEGADISFETRLAEAGQHEVVFFTPNDSLATDNQAYLVVQSVQRVPVVVVGDDNPNEPGTATYFLVRALGPRGDAVDNLDVRHLSSADLNYGRISDAEAVFVSYVGRLGAEALKALHLYANQGGGVVFFCGQGPVNENLLAFSSLAKHEELLPWAPGTARDLTASGEFLQISEGKWNSQLLSDFDEQSRYALSQIRFSRVWGAGRLKPSAVSLLTFSDGTPAVAAQHVGSGRMVVCNFSPSLVCSDLGKYGSFVALTHCLTHFVRPRKDWRGQATVGKSFTFAAGAGTEGNLQKVKVIGPDTRDCQAKLSGDSHNLLVHLDHPTLPGFYKLISDSGPLSTAAVNCDPRESDLRTIDEKLVREHLRNENLGLEVRGLEQEGPILNVRGRPLWPNFLAAAMAVLALEMILLAVWKR